MANRSSFTGKIRSYGGRNKRDAAPGTAILTMEISGDPTEADETSDAARCRIGSSATTGELAILPKGAMPLFIQTLGGATGGTTPTVDIGSPADDDGIFNEVDAADSPGTTATTVGALAAVGGLTDDTQVTCTVGTSAATGGTWTGILGYAMSDDGKDGTDAS